MNLIPCLCALLLLGAFHVRNGLAVSNDAPILGFSAERVRAQRELEARFDQQIEKQNFDVWMKWMSSKPHHLGSPFGKEVAEFIAKKFREFGLETRIEQFEVLFPTPKTRLVELLEPNHFTASLEEPGLAEDETSRTREGQLPVYNAYSRDGDVTGELVYANYGLPEDYDLLAEKGINVKGRIVIVRYGNSWRGVKPKVAAERGAIGCIIYSDPKGDGYYMGDAYPKGPWRSDLGAQRGSVADFSQYPGDPATPGIGATNGARRIPLAQIPTITKIPVLPLSHADALPLLKALDGPVAPQSWRGALPLTYHLGPGPAKVRLALQFDWKQVPVYNVIGILKGSEEPDRWVIRGNHHDGWVFGANDPLSGTVTLMEEARIFGKMVHDGWRPKRTLMFAAWDGEEPGLLGSTEWAEAHETELRQHAVAYLNGDLNTRGFLEAGGSHTLQRLVNEVIREVQDPDTGKSVRDRLRVYMLVLGNTEARRIAKQNKDVPLAPLGSGSDYSPFLQHLGIPSLDLRYDDDRSMGAYHSIYDSYDHYTRFVNPGFTYNVTLAQTMGRVLLRLTESEILPFEFSGFAERVEEYTREVVKMADDLREGTEQTNEELAQGIGKMLVRPGEVYIQPQPKAVPPHFNFAPLQNAVARLREQSIHYESIVRMALRGDALQRGKVNDLLQRVEQAMLDEKGLPGRPWFRHLIYAPGAYTGYAAKTLPAVRESLELRQWNQVNAQIVRTAEALNRVVDLLTALKKEARRASQP